MWELDKRNPDQVAYQHELSADLGIGNRHLLVVSGNATPNWKVDTDELMYATDVVVKTRVPADFIEQKTLTVGLSSIANDDTAFTFAVDSADAVINDVNEIDLKVSLALQGEWSALNRFSYQLVATVIRTTSEISGRIKWPRATFLPDNPEHPASYTSNLRVTASLYEARHVSSGREGPDFGTLVETITPVAAGEIVGVDLDPEFVYVKYRVVNPPKNQQLKITVDSSVRIVTLRPPRSFELEFAGVQDRKGLIQVTTANPNGVMDFDWIPETRRPR